MTFRGWLLTRKWELLSIALLAVLIFLSVHFFLRGSSPGLTTEILNAGCAMALFVYSLTPAFDKQMQQLIELRVSFLKQRRSVFGAPADADRKLTGEEEKLYNDEFDRAISRYSQFLDQFRNVFLSYFLLFTILIILDCGKKDSVFQEPLSIAAFTLNNMGCWYLFKCFTILYIPSRQHHPERVKAYLFSFSFYILSGLTVIYTIAVYGPENRTFFETQNLTVIPSTGNSFFPEEKTVQRPKTENEPFIDDEGKSTSHGEPGKTKDAEKEYVNIKGHIYVDSTRKDDSTPLKLALRLSGLLTDTLLKLPDGFFAQDTGSKMKTTRIRVLVRDTMKPPQFRQDILVMEIKPTSDTLFKTSYPIVLDGLAFKTNTFIHKTPFIQFYKDESVTAINKLFDIISGLINALVFALLVGRMDSRFIGVRKMIIICLFLYPALQPLYIYFGTISTISDILKPGVIGFALCLKIFLFLVVYYIAQSGRLLTYLFCFGELDVKADLVYNNQVEIMISKDEHHEHFKMAILNNGKKIMSCEAGFSSPKECLNYIKRLQEDIVKGKLVSEELIADPSYFLHWKSRRKDWYSKEHSGEEMKALDAELKSKLLYCKISGGA